MPAKTVFKRYELKYLLDEDQLGAVEEAIGENMVHDAYAHSSIRNIYFDTDSFLLARRSIEKPPYKEKLRIRSYGEPGDGDVFVELKKKYDSVVYKRRVEMPLDDAMGWLAGRNPGPDTQIGHEIGYLTEHYPGIRPAMLLCYEREAFCGRDGGDLRITLDTDITARTSDVDLRGDVRGTDILPEGTTLMEIKSMYGYPEWLLSVLAENRILKSSFSKYGNAYKQMMSGRMPRPRTAAYFPEEALHIGTVSVPATGSARGCNA